MGIFVIAGLEGRILSIAIFIVAIALGIHQALERKRRPEGVSGIDSLFFRDQDHRRAIITVVLAVIAAGIWRGAVLDRHAPRAIKAAWAYTWLAVGALVIGLLILGFYDWWAVGRYARRQRDQLIETGRAEAKALREGAEGSVKRQADRNGSKLGT